MRSVSWAAIAIVFFALMVAVIERTSAGIFTIYDDGTQVGQRAGINVASGRGIDITSADDGANNRSTITVNTDAQSGAATLSASATSTNVTHGLGAAPGRVLLTPTSDTEGQRWWVSASSTLVFTIEMNATTTADVTFDWRAQSEE